MSEKRIKLRDAPPNAVCVRVDAWPGEVFVTGPTKGAWFCYSQNGTPTVGYTVPTDPPTWRDIWSTWDVVVIGHAEEAPTYTASRGSDVFDALVNQPTFKLTTLLSEAPTMPPVVREKLAASVLKATAHRDPPRPAVLTEGRAALLYEAATGSVLVYAGGEKRFWRVIGMFGSTPQAATWRDDSNAQGRPTYRTYPDDSSDLILLAEATSSIPEINATDRLRLDARKMLRDVLALVDGIDIDAIPDDAAAKALLRAELPKPPPVIEPPDPSDADAPPVILIKNAPSNALFVRVGDADEGAVFSGASMKPAEPAEPVLIKMCDAPPNAIVVTADGHCTYVTAPNNSSGHELGWLCLQEKNVEWVDYDRRKEPDWCQQYQNAVIVVGAATEKPDYDGASGKAVIRAVARHPSFTLKVPLASVPEHVRNLITASMGSRVLADPVPTPAPIAITPPATAKPKHKLRVIPAGEKLPPDSLLWNGNYLFWTDEASRAAVIAKKRDGAIGWQSRGTALATTSGANAIVLGSSGSSDHDDTKRIPRTYRDTAFQKDMIDADIPAAIRAELLDANIFYESDVLPPGTIAFGGASRAYYVADNGDLILFSSTAREALSEGKYAPVGGRLALRVVAIGCTLTTGTLAGTIASGRCLPGAPEWAVEVAAAGASATASGKAGDAAAKVPSRWLNLVDGRFELSDRPAGSASWQAAASGTMTVPDAVRALTMSDRVEAARRLSGLVTSPTELRVRLDDLHAAPAGTVVVYGGDALLIRIVYRGLDGGTHWQRVVSTTGTMLRTQGASPDMGEVVTVVRYGSSTNRPYAVDTIAKLLDETGVAPYLTPGALFTDGYHLGVMVGFRDDCRPTFWFDNGDGSFVTEEGWTRTVELTPVFTPPMDDAVTFVPGKSPFRQVIAHYGKGLIGEAVTTAIAGKKFTHDLTAQLIDLFVKLNAPPERAEESMPYPIGTILLSPGLRAPLVVVDERNFVALPRVDGGTCVRSDAFPLAEGATVYELYRPSTPTGALYGVQALQYILLRMGSRGARQIMDVADGLVRLNLGYEPGRAILRDFCRALYAEEAAFIDYAPFNDEPGLMDDAPFEPKVLVERNAGQSVVSALTLGAQMAAAKTASDVVHAGAMKIVGPVAGTPIVRLATPIALRYTLDQVPDDALPFDKRHVEKGVELAIAAQAYETARDVIAALLPMFAKLAGLAEKAEAAPLVEVIDVDADTDHGFDIPDLPAAAVEVIDTIEVRRD